MVLDLSGIIDVPGGKIKSSFQPDLSLIPTGSIVRIKDSPKVIFEVTNRAGLIGLNAKVSAICDCECARCLKEFELPLDTEITADLIKESENAENSDNYIIKDKKIDINEIIVTELLLNLNDSILCKEDCNGLCEKCGLDLNYGKCDCSRDIDPRLAVLANLLEK